MKRSSVRVVELPISPIITLSLNIYLDLSHLYFIHFQLFKMLWDRYLPRALEIIFEVQRKRSNENIARKPKKKAFQVTRCVFSFLFFGPLLLSKLIIF